MLAAVSFLLASALLSRALSKPEYGIFRQCWMMFLLATPVLAMGVGPSLFYFVPKLSGRANRGLVLRSLGLVLGTGAVSAVVIGLGADGIASALSEGQGEEEIAIFGIFLGASIPFLLVDGVFLSVSRPMMALLFNIAGRFVILAACAFPVWALGWDLNAGLWSLALTQLALTAVLFVTAAHAHGGGEEGGRVVGVREQLGYSWPVAAAGVFGAVFLQLDKLLVSLMMTAEDFAVYANGAMENPLVGIVASVSGAVMATDLVKLSDRGSVKDFVGLWNRANRKIGAVVLPMTALMLFYAGEVVELIFSRTYSDSTDVFRVYVLLAPVRMVGFQTVFVALNKNRIYLWAHVAACALTLGAGLGAFFLLGASGVAWSVVAVSYGIMLWLLSKMADLLMTPLSRLLPWAFLVQVGLVAVGGAAASRLIAEGLLGLEGFLLLAVGGALFGIIAAGTLFGFGILRWRDWVRLR